MDRVINQHLLYATIIAFRLAIQHLDLCILSFEIKFQLIWFSSVSNKSFYVFIKTL
uniref:Uncharacterized protein n=1 Tax=Arundo donax TaxID=35708 RepID=A0A0A9A3N8_ARUDO